MSTGSFSPRLPPAGRQHVKSTERRREEASVIAVFFFASSSSLLLLLHASAGEPVTLSGHYRESTLHTLCLQGIYLPTKRRKIGKLSSFAFPVPSGLYLYVLIL